MKTYFLSVLLLLGVGHAIAVPKKSSSVNADTSKCGQAEVERRQEALIKDRIAQFFDRYLPTMPKPFSPSFSCSFPDTSTTKKIRDFLWHIFRQIT